MDIKVILVALPIVLGIIATLWTKWVKAKNLLKEVSGALTALSNAVEDDRFTDEEMADLMKELKDVIDAAADLFAK